MPQTLSTSSLSALAQGVASILLCEQRVRYDAALQKPKKGVKGMEEKILRITSSVSVVLVQTRKDMLRKKAGTAVAQALLQSCSPGVQLVCARAPCQVGEGRAFWASCGMAVAGAENHPMPAPGSHGAAMPRHADARVLSHTVVATQWQCARCQKMSAATAVFCEDVECGARCALYPTLMHLV